ncbi:HIT domain-containing protein [Rhodanobacter sp. DHG33]|uniref:HIT family protein n=1 Tax=Rhodanobacter sp. DHG33 TaxID=2775921 RepID=UPI001782B929|nr:HIT domain-containing protein [Rhodanobacter sp. DHG33]MBD8897335.1 HIT domain-containing protein [Rhodanobacter sp. DHG33]
MNGIPCPFCAIAAGEAPASIVADDGDMLAFMDLRQAVPGHVLVVPRRHAPDLCALTPDEAAAAMRMAQRVALALQDEFHPAGFNVWQSNGLAAGQEVFHFHLHVQPRGAADGLSRIYSGDVPEPVPTDRLDAWAQALRQRMHGRSHGDW